MRCYPDGARVSKESNLVPSLSWEDWTTSKPSFEVNACYPLTQSTGHRGAVPCVIGLSSNQNPSNIFSAHHQPPKCRLAVNQQPEIPIMPSYEAALPCPGILRQRYIQGCPALPTPSRLDPSIAEQTKDWDCYSDYHQELYRSYFQHPWGPPTKPPMDPTYPDNWHIPCTQTVYAPAH